MGIRQTIFIILCLLTLLSPAGAQDNREKVELLLMDGSLAIFCSEGYADSKREAVENSCIAVLRQLLYTGVEDFNGGFPIVSNPQENNIWLRDFFTGKYPAYKNFLSDIELVGDFDSSPTGEIHCQTNVVIKYELLLIRARSQGLMEDSSPSQSQQKDNSRPKKSFL